MADLSQILHDAIQEGALPRATMTVHWATGPVLCCSEHAEKLVALGRIMGQHTPAMPYVGDEPCINCVNEAKKSKQR